MNLDLIKPIGDYGTAIGGFAILLALVIKLLRSSIAERKNAQNSLIHMLQEQVRDAIERIRILEHDRLEDERVRGDRMERAVNRCCNVIDKLDRTISGSDCPRLNGTNVKTETLVAIEKKDLHHA